MQDFKDSVYGKEQGSSNALNIPPCDVVFTPSRPSADTWQKLSTVLDRALELLLLLQDMKRGGIASCVATACKRGSFHSLPATPSSSYAYYERSKLCQIH